MTIGPGVIEKLKTYLTSHYVRANWCPSCGLCSVQSATGGRYVVIHEGLRDCSAKVSVGSISDCIKAHEAMIPVTAEMQDEG